MTIMREREKRGTLVTSYDHDNEVCSMIYFSSPFRLGANISSRGACAIGITKRSRRQIKRKKSTSPRKTLQVVRLLVVTRFAVITGCLLVLVLRTSYQLS